MKKIIIIFLLFSMNIDAQVTGIVSYGFMVNDFKTNIKRDKIFEELNKQSGDVIFVLNFKGKESIFKVDDKMEIEINSIGKSYAKTIVGKGSFYTDLNKDLTIRKAEVYGEVFLIRLNPSSNNWKLSTDSKLIGKYKCFKATMSKAIENQSGKYIFEIIAWYAPEIPVSFGPKEYNNLPGLILELKGTHYTFYAKNIELYPKKELKLLEFSGVIISQEEFSKKTLNIMSNFKK